MKIISILLLFVGTLQAQNKVGDTLFYRDYINTRIGVNTITPTTTLDINGVVNATSFLGPVTGASSLNVLKTGDTMTGPLTLSGSTLTVTGNAFSVGGSTFVVSGGKVGIGIAAPTAMFQVEGSMLVKNTGDNTADISMGGGSLIMRAKGSPYDGYVFGYRNLYLGSNNVETGKLTILSGGNVGIGTTAPAEKVDIASGTIHIAGSGAPATGGALCLNAAGSMSKCTSIIDVSGNCTCP